MHNLDFFSFDINYNLFNKCTILKYTCWYTQKVRKSTHVDRTAIPGEYVDNKIPEASSEQNTDSFNIKYIFRGKKNYHPVNVLKHGTCISFSSWHALKTCFIILWKEIMFSNVKSQLFSPIVGMLNTHARKYG